MKKVLKYSLTDSLEHEIPKDAKFLKIALVGRATYIWFLVDPEVDTETRKFIFYGTGWSISKDTQTYYYLDTLIDKDDFVWHWFETL